MTYTATKKPSFPVPVEPAVLSVYVPNSSASTNIPVYIPWKNCELVYAYTVAVGVVDGTGDMEIDLELNAAGGTEMMTITVAASAAIGDIDEATVSSADACKNLDRNNSDRDAVNIEVDGSADATGAVMLYMYFAPTRFSH